MSDLLHLYLPSAHPTISKILVSLVVLAAAEIFVRIAGRTLETTFRKIPSLDETFLPLTKTVVRYSAYGAAVLAVLSVFGVDTTGIFALLGAAGIAVGLALKDTLSNIDAGIVLLFLHPFKNGDYIETPSVGGKVAELNLFVTILETADGLNVTVPNGVLWGAPVKNYSHNPTRRLSIEIGISYGDSIDAAFDVLRRLIDEEPRILKDPAPRIFLKTLADSSVNIEMRAWTNNADFWDVQWDMNKKIKTEIEKAGLSFPFPQRDVHLFQK